MENSDGPNPPLDEQNFIQEGYSKNPFPLWIWLAIIATIAALIWGSANWVQNRMDNAISHSPFMKVTNRQMSLFLWQFSEYMRGNVPVKEGYMPGFNFKDNKISMVLGETENYVSAPPDVVFLYHTWARLLKSESSFPTISLDLFKEFLSALPEWKPENWKDAPTSYKDLVSGLDTLSEKDFSAKSHNLPFDVQIAFVGWKNYFKDGTAIDSLSPTYGQMEEFLTSHPNYARNFWRNIVLHSRPDYLKGNFSKKFDPKAKIPENELTGFLRVGFYDDMQANSKK